MQNDELKKSRRKFKTVAFLPQDKTGCGYYRTALPSAALCRRGIPAHLLTGDRVHLYHLANTLVFQRHHQTDIIDFIKDAQNKGIEVLYETDDNVFEVPEYNQSYMYWTDYRKQSVKEIMAACDGVVTTTEYLADVLLKYNNDVRVVPNAIYNNMPFSVLPSYLSLSDDFIVGWIGSSYHKKDLLIFEQLIPTLLNKYNNLKFLTMGEPPPRKLNMFGPRIITLPFVEPILYHKILSQFSIQVGIAPLVDNEFNRCKSPVKMLEYLYTKTFPIMSDIYPYADLLQNNDFGMLIPTTENTPGTVDDWVDRIDWCINNRDKMETLAEKGHDYILENYTIDSDNMFKFYRTGYSLDK